MKTKEQIHIGIYRLGDTNVDLLGRAGFGGDFYFVPDNKSLPRIKIGFKPNHWWEVVSVLLHETFEYLCAARMAPNFGRHINNTKYELLENLH